VHDIELHIFTNSTVNSPSVEIINKTYKSFCNKFGILSPTVWCDTTPNVLAADEYIKNLREVFSTVSVTSSLSDGYVKAINQSTASYLFMLEHDWEFLDTITHSLNEIVCEMEHWKHWYMQFHQHNNNEIIGREGLRERARLEVLPYVSVPHCSTTHVSNNPHVIHRQRYIDTALKHIKIREGSEGIEWELIKTRKLTGTIYGSLGHQKTIRHLNGKIYHGHH
jgi:hypothetical protein